MWIKITLKMPACTLQPGGYNERCHEVRKVDILSEVQWGDKEVQTEYL